MKSDFVMKRPAEKRMRMAYQRGMSRAWRPGIEQRLKAPGLTGEK